MTTVLAKKFSKLFFVTTLLFSWNFSFAQDQTLEGKYQEMIEDSETYEIYKVIRSTRLDNFWKEAMDSINTQNVEIAELQSNINALNEKINNQNARINTLEKELVASNETNNTIGFLGIDFNKAVYHVIVWAIVGACVLMIFILFGMFKRSNAVTANALKDFHELEGEYDSHKAKSHEKYVKIKRELQTAVNKLEEMRKSKSSKSGVKESIN